MDEGSETQADQWPFQEAHFRKHSRSSGLQSDALGNKEPSPGMELNTEVQKGRCESAGPRKEGTVRGDCTNTRAGVL